MEVTKNPHTAVWLDEAMIETIESIKRVDEKGLLYKMNCVHDYYGKTIVHMLKQMGTIDAGCSAFSTYNVEGKMLTGRNYDYKHFDNKGELTGLNVVVRCAPEGKYRSIGVADAYWLDAQNRTFSMGALDDGLTDLSHTVLLPYICMDGINEKGLSVSILELYLKKGEAHVNQNEEGKEKVIHTVLMRYMLDECETVDEAITMAKRYNVIKTNNSDFHIFITDRVGKAVVLEWRYNTLYITETNAVTNFYVGFDDAEDVYRKGDLVENFVKLDNTAKTYHYGYGHGYHRFTGIISALERYIDYTEETYVTKMTDEEARDILRGAAQNPGTEATSMTQYSVLYNAMDLSAKVWVNQNYNMQYNFVIK